MDTSSHSGKNEGKTAVSSKHPEDIKDWNKYHVRAWMLEINVDREDADFLYNERINGASLLLLEATDFRQLGLSMNAIKLIVHNVDLLKQKTQQQNDMASLSCSMKPYPFNRFNTAHRYRENTTLDVTETGPIDLIQPCHEFKGFTNTTEEDRMKKYTYEVIRFAAACMNSRTNGTIHFGVADKPHGQILGVNIPKTDDFDVQQSHAIERHFKWEKNVQIAKMCIKPPRFVEVLKVDMMSSGKYVIEVDIEPSSNVCQDLHFSTYDLEKNNKNLKNKDKMSEPKKNNESKSFFIRDGSSSKNIITSDSSKEYEKYLANMAQLSQLRKEAEEKHLSVVKTSVQGSKLCEMITGGTQSLDRSHFKSYIVVANKSHPVQLENLRFLLHMDLVAVLDFDPESAEHGLNKLFEERKTNVHSPTQYKITGAVEDIADKLKLTKNTSWVFCNGGINNESPSDADKWLIEKGSSVHDVISFLCRRDVLPHKKFLTIFLLLNQVNDRKDPLLETLKFFLQELKGENQILCITDNKTSYTYWKDLIDVADISKRCIYELSFAEVNGTVLSLWSENRKSSRFLPCGGGSVVVLSKKTEESLEMLSILCVNQCEGGNEDKQHHEEIFYKGGKVSWWNFYFSEQPGSMPFIKRDKFDYIINTIIPDTSNLERSCAFFNIFHLPGCGGTTLAMHVLWTLKDKFRCATLQDSTGDYTAAAEQVVQLLTYETNEQPTRLPVLLMIDDFQDISDVKKFQLQIEEECQRQKIYSKSPQVVIVNCMRVETCELTDRTDNSVFIGNKLSKKEQELFMEKLKEIKKTNTNNKTFYGFMILMTNFSSEYIQSVVKKTLKGFNFEHKHAQLFAVLVLLHVYRSNAVLSVSTCEEFLGLQTKADFKFYTVEDGFERFSNLLTRFKVNSKVNFEGVRVIHLSIAKQCLQELSASHGVTKAEITNILLTTELFYEYTLGKQKLRQDVHNMLVKRQYSAENKGSLFSPLIQDIMKETPGTEQFILHNAEKCLRKDAYISQLLARYYYIKKQDFLQAMYWAKKAKSHLTENSYICDTEFQVRMHELKHAVYKDKDDPIKPENLDEYLTLAQKASEACKETQKTADKEAKHQLDKRRVKRDYKNYQTYNTAGHLSELQTGVKVIQILQKTPLFNSKDTCNNCLSQFLMSKITIEDLLSKNPRLKPYYPVLLKHKRYLLQLKEGMKKHFLFLDNFLVNLVPFFAEKDRQKELTMHRMSKYFQQYTALFCDMNWGELINNKHVNSMAKIEQTRQCLEKNKGDSYTGLLEHLYQDNSASTLEEIIQQYDFFASLQRDKPLMDMVNFIYANVILANIKPESQFIMPYPRLCELLSQINKQPAPFSEILPLHYITILLLWEEGNVALPAIVSQMKASYFNELNPVYNGKRAAVHFYLGKDEGYAGLISQRDINRCLAPGQDIATLWDNESIWKKVRDSEKLLRVSGEIRDGFISVAGIRVDPMFKSQIYKESGTRVNCYIGLSMNGPVALDIDFE